MNELDEVARLRADVAQVEATVREMNAQLGATLLDLKQRLHELQRTHEDTGTRVPAPVERDAASAPVRDAAAAVTERPTTRRNLIRSAGAVSAGLVAGSVLQSKPAAANADQVTRGAQTNTAAETEIRLTSNAPVGNHVFLAQSTAYDTASRTAAVAGLAGRLNVFNGVYGYTEGRDASGNTGHAVIAFAGDNARSHVWLVPWGAAPTGEGFSHSTGEIRCQANGELWYCTNSGTPGTWKKLSGPSTAGGFHLLALPQRAYDSRPSQGGAGPVTAGTSQAVNVKTPSVPTGFTGVLCNLTVVTPGGPGFAVLYADGVAQPATSNINFIAGDIVANSVTTAVSTTGFARFYTSATSNYIVDVIGYFR